MKKVNRNITILITAIFLIAESCGHTISSDKFVYDIKFDSLYKAISNTDTFFFENSKNGIDTFILTKTDSALVNRVNCFMCTPVGKTVYRYYKQYPINYWSDTVLENQGTSQEKKVAREVPLVTIATSLDSNSNTAYISFKNFHCNIENSIGKPSIDTLRIGGNLFVNYYILKSTAKSLVVNNADVETVYLSQVRHSLF